MGVVFRILNAQLENGGSKNMLDWKMSVFRAGERWGDASGTCDDRNRDIPSDKRFLSALNGRLS
jgi:hypothetical protein